MNSLLKHVSIVVGCAVLAVCLSGSPKSIRATSQWYVAPTGNNNSSCATPAAPCATVQSAINKATAHDVINIATGVYTDTGEAVIVLNQSLTLVGGWDAGFVARNGLSTIDGSGTRRVITLASGISVTLQHLVVQHGIGSDGGGIHNLATLIIEDSAIQDNSSSAPGGGTSHGGGIYSLGNLTLNRVSIVRNSVSGSGGGLYNGATAKIVNSTFSQNNSIWGSAIYNDGGTVELKNDTIYRNQADNSGALDTTSGTVTLQNTILAGNLSMDCMAFFGSAGPISQGYNFIGTTVWCNFTAQATDHIGVEVQVNSRLIGLPGYYALWPTSPAVNSGTPGGCTDTAGAPLTIDQRGLTRDGLCDVGAYEFIPPGPIASLEIVGGAPQHTRPNSAFPEPFQLFTLDSQGTPATGASVFFSAPMSGASGIFTDTSSYTTTVSVDGAGLATAPTFIANAVEGAYNITATAGLSGPTVAFTVGNTSSIYVAPTGNDAHSCWTAAVPCASVNAAVSQASPGDTLYVATGSYTTTGSTVVYLNKSITLTAGWDPLFTSQTGYSVFDGEGVRRVMLVPAGVIAHVDHAIIQNGYNPINEGSAGGVHNEGTLTMADSFITRNGGFTGVGGLSNFGGQVTLNRTAVIHNSGGLLNQISYTSNGVLILNAVTVAYNTGYYGGIYNGPWDGSRVYINNSAIFENASSFQAGGVTNQSQLVVINSSTIANNRSDYADSGLTSRTGTTVLTNTLISDGCGGAISSQGYNLVEDTSRCNFMLATGDLVNVNPHLVQLDMTVALPGSSPAVDHGNPAGCTDSSGHLITIDQRGAPRIGRCDIGAYEYTLPGLPASIYASQGTPQHAPIQTAFGQPFRALVLDSISSLVDNHAVAFSAPVTGVSGTFTDTGTFTTTSVTDEYGMATAATFKANTQVGAYTVTATVNNVIIPANFSLTNLAQVYLPLVIHTQ